MDMRERIARAIHKADWIEPFPEVRTDDYAHAMSIADAVLEALRDPTDAMLQWPIIRCWTDDARMIQGIWSTMIDAAKNETTETQELPA